jgi:hypothetical protein
MRETAWQFLLFPPPHSDWLRSTKTEHRKKENYIDAAERASSALARRRSQKTHETEAFACPLNRVNSTQAAAPNESEAP